MYRIIFLSRLLIKRLHMTALDLLGPGLLHDPLSRTWTYPWMIESTVKSTSLRIRIPWTSMNKRSWPRAHQITCFTILIFRYIKYAVKCNSFPSSTYAEQGKNSSVLFSVLYMIRGLSSFILVKLRGKENGKRERSIYIYIFDPCLPQIFMNWI